MMIGAPNQTSRWNPTNPILPRTKSIEPLDLMDEVNQTQEEHNWNIFLRKSAFNLFLLVSALLPAMFLLFWGLMSFSMVLTSFELSDLPFLIYNGLALLGFVGLLILAINDWNRKSLVWANICLILGTVGFFAFFDVLSVEGAWEWFWKVEEPAEFLLTMWPIFVGFYFLIINLIRFISIRQRNTKGEK